MYYSLLTYYIFTTNFIFKFQPSNTDLVLVLRFGGVAVVVIVVGAIVTLSILH